MKSKQHWVFRVFKGLLMLGFLLIEVAFATKKREEPKYNVHEAQQLFDDGLIGVSEYVDCLHKD